MELPDNNEHILDEDFAPNKKPLHENVIHGATGGTQEIVQAGIDPLMQQNRDWNSIDEKLRPSLKGKMNKQLSPSLREKMNKHLQDKRITDSLAIIDLFNRNNINYVVLKGLTLQFFNKNRIFFDLDIFVPHPDFEKAVSSLESMGYSQTEDDVKLWNMNKGFHIRMKCPEKILVELHYFLFDCSYIDESRLPILHNKRYLTIGGVHVPCPSQELQLLEIILHNVYSHAFIADYERWCTDIECILRNNEINWDTFIDLVVLSDSNERVYRAITLINLFNTQKLNIPVNVIRTLYHGSSGIRLFFTRGFDVDFYINYEKIETKFNSLSERARLDWKLRCSVLFSVGLNRDFLTLLFFRIYMKFGVIKQILRNIRGYLHGYQVV